MRSTPVRITIRVVAVVLSLLAMWFSYHLTVLHYKQSPAAAGRPATQTATQTAAAPATAPAGELSLLDQACTSLLPNTGCEDVIHSEWGSIRFGNEQVPVALLGLYYFTCVFWWFLLIGDVSPRRGWVYIPVACMMAVGLGTSVFFVYQMSKLPEWCPICAASHVANLLLFICMLLLWPRSIRLDAADQMPPAPTPAPAASESLFAAAPPAVAAERTWPHWWMLLVTPIVAVLSIYVESLTLRPLPLGPVASTAPAGEVERLQDTIKKVQEYYDKQLKIYQDNWQHTVVAYQLSPTFDINTEGEPVRGPADARHTLVVFSDFQCPTCRQFEQTIESRIVPMAKPHGGMRVFFKQWPISTKCNPVAIRDLHPSACPAALAAEAAFMLGGNDAFWKMHDLLFANQAEWKGSLNFDRYASEIGLDVDAFHRAMESPEASERVKADILEGANLGKDLVAQGQLKSNHREVLAVDSTPSIFLNGKRLSPLHHVQAWNAILRQPPTGRPQEPKRPQATQPYGPRIQQ